MTHAGPVPVLAGERCTLRALTSADAPSIARHANDAAVVRNLFEGFPHPYTLAHAEAWCGPQHREPQYGHVFAIDVAGEAVGCLGVMPQPGFLACNAMVGYWIGQAHWGRGIAAEALELATRWAWDALPRLTRLYAPIFVRNAASQRVVEKAGYQREALLPRSMIRDGQVLDIVQYATYREDHA